MDPNDLLKPSKNAKPFRISGNTAAKNLIGRLNEGVRSLCALRKVSTDIIRKTDAATSLVYSCCYDIGLVYAYADGNFFDKVCICIRKLTKAVGLDRMTDSIKLYQVSTRISPKLMAIKQILQLGLKFVDPEIVRQNKFKVPRAPFDNLRPFWSVFCQEFDSLPMKSRQFIVNNLNFQDPSKISKIKNHLKAQFFNVFNPEGKISAAGRSNFLHRNLYSREKNKKRKADYEEKRILMQETLYITESLFKFRHNVLR